MTWGVNLHHPTLKNWKVSALVISALVKRGCSSEPRLVPSSAAVSLMSRKSPTGGVPDRHHRASQEGH